MMRIILTGSPGTLYRPTPADIPADNDLTNSVFRYVDFHGLDLSAYILTDTDFLDCDCRNVILPSAIGHMMSRRTDWSGASIPATIPSLNHDLVIEAMKQIAPLVGAQARAAGKVVLDHMQPGGVTDYRTSWRDGFQALKDAYPNLNIEMLRTRITPVFAARPRLASRLVKAYQEARALPSQWPSWAAIAIDGQEYDFTTEVAAADGDRWLLARSIEVTLNTLTAREWLCHVEQIEPWPFVEVISASSWSGPEQWWRGLGYLDS